MNQGFIITLTSILIFSLLCKLRKKSGWKSALAFILNQYLFFFVF